MFINNNNKLTVYDNCMTNNIKQLKIDLVINLIMRIL